MTDFTLQQLEAIEFRDNDACIVAGPGAGKTTVLVERYAKLVEVHGIQPHQILAITFTEKAAANMKSKLAEKFTRNAELRRDFDASAWVSTIHGFCMRLLRENAIAAGVDPRFSVLSPRESDTLQWECLQFALDELTASRRPATLDLIEALHSPYLAGDLKEVYDGIRSAGMTIDDVRAMRSPSQLTADALSMVAELRSLVEAWPWKLTPTQTEEKGRLLEWCARFDQSPSHDFVSFMEFATTLKLHFGRVPVAVKPGMRDFQERFEQLKNSEVDRHAAPFRAMIFDVLARFDEEYRRRKNARGKVDFNDLERYSIALLKNNPEVVRKVHAQFRQVMLDEFQDINGQQSELISLLRPVNVFFGVGDVNQSIYGFRHARPEIFTQYRDDVVFRAGQSVDLLHNFRSRQSILNCVRELLTGAEGITPRDLIAGASFARKDEPSIEVMEIRDQDDDKDKACEREAAWISHRVLALKGVLLLGESGKTQAAEFRDFAVLCRNGDSMPPVLAAFERAGIPYVCGRRQSFLLSRIGLDITALLSVIANPRDGISLATLLRGPLVGISDEGLLRLRLLAGSLTSGLNKFAYAREHAGIPDSDASKLTAFIANLARWRNDQPLIPLDVLITRALDDCAVNWTPTSQTGANIERFLDLARTLDPEMDLPSVLDELEGLAKAADIESELSDEDQGDSVRVMTAHAAKGLEFPVTIIAAMDKGSRIESSPVTFTPEHGLGVKWRNPAVKATAAVDNKGGLKDSWSEANSVVAGLRENQEENRLLYVAMTRAAEHLILSWSRGKNKASNWAKRIDGYFGVNQLPPSLELQTAQQGDFAAGILATESDPPAWTRSGDSSSDREVQFLSKPLIEDRYETTVAVTSLAVFGACPRKYYIQRSLGWNTGRFRRFDPDEISTDDAAGAADEVEGDLSASRIGSAVHQILAGQQPADDAPEARQLAEVFLKSDLARLVAASPRVEREWAFIVEIDGIILRGTIDLWFQDGASGAIHLVDYKTDEVAAGDAKADAQARAQEYAPQLALYAIALERALGTKPKFATLHFLRPDVVVEIPLDDATVNGALSLISALREAQNMLRFNLNEGGHCRTCQFFRSLCPAGRSDRPDAILEGA